jgi:hypothetical protein
VFLNARTRPKNNKNKGSEYTHEVVEKKRYKNIDIIFQNIIGTQVK